MEETGHPDRQSRIQSAVAQFGFATSGKAQPDLFQPLTFLLAQVRQSLGMDVAFVSQFVDVERVFEVVSSEGEEHASLAPGHSDPLLDTYCQRIVDGRLPVVIPDTSLDPEAAGLPITEALTIRAYLSAPVVFRNGKVFGTVCCISHTPRHDLRQADARALQAVADAVAAAVEQRNGRIRYASWTDPSG